jgi:hypothetical protein
MILGICDGDYRATHLKELYDEGFRGLFISIHEHANDDPIVLSNRMYNTYMVAKDIGFTHFLIECGQGLGFIDGGYSWKVIMDKFRDKKDVAFYFDEYYELIVEKYKRTKDDYCRFRKEVLRYANDVDNLNEVYIPTVFTTTVRNHTRGTAISSYYNQHIYWAFHDYMVWIYGQIKLGGSLRYKKLADVAGYYHISFAYLYQRDPVKFNIKDPTSWFNWVFPKTVKRFLRGRFVKSFGAGNGVKVGVVEKAGRWMLKCMAKRLRVRVLDKDGSIMRRREIEV